MTSVRRARRKMARWSRYTSRYQYWLSNGAIRAEVRYTFAAERAANRRGETTFVCTFHEIAQLIREQF